MTGSVTVESDNIIDIVDLLPLLQHPLGLQLDSISIVTIGSRTGTVGDYPRVYDSEIGTPPYAGRRETWLIMRLPIIDNAQALRWRTSVGLRQFRSLSASPARCGAKVCAPRWRPPPTWSSWIAGWGRTR
ncbi:hypothetical protein BZL30_3941 [Mycobacterium kansasii]|uniref:Uncharacterized protein n=1 Tax=Mycobacterium kansasii TaxID=1768 RepID=A0A1V3XB34_MYCKA|nr:hypothetical protein BZL30_3941 [Mycobacterium kansasii]